MADPRYVGSPVSPALPAWPPPPVPLPPPPLPSQPHPQFNPQPPLFSPFPGRPAMPGFDPGFAPQQHRYYNAGPPPFPPPFSPPPRSFYGSNSAGLPASRGPFGPHPPALPPPRGQPQIGPGMVLSSNQSPGGGAGHVMSGSGIAPAHGGPRIGVPADSMQFSRTTSPLGVARRENLGLGKQEEGINVVEKAILQAQKEEKVDVKELLSQIRALVAQAEDTVQKVGKVAKVHPCMVEPRLVTCPFDSTHRVPPEALFKHFLCCPSNPKPQENAEYLISSLQYPHTTKSLGQKEASQSQDKTLEVQIPSLDKGSSNSSVFCSDNLKGAGIQGGKDTVKDPSSIIPSETEDMSKTSIGNEIDIWGGRFFYKDSPAVVQAPLAIPYPPLSSGARLQLTNVVDQLGAKVESADPAESVSVVEGSSSLQVKEGATGGCLQPLLSSSLWFLLRETETWNELPTRCSSLVLQAAAGLVKIRRKMVLEWLLMQGPGHGIVIDSPLASHISSLAILCLKSLRKEASALIGSQSDMVKQRDRPPTSDDKESLHKIDSSVLTEAKKEITAVPDYEGRSVKVTCLDCPHLFQSGHWLASELSSLFGPFQSKVFVLKLLKHCLASSGRFLASSFVDASSEQAADSSPQLDTSFPKEFEDSGLKRSEDSGQIGKNLLQSMDETVDGSIAPLEVEAAVAAIHERAVLENYLRTLNYPNKPKNQLIQEHEALVAMAAVERQKRVNYRPVSEHDGLIWHRSQLEDKNKNKTREEILAEERDYKRRRMSYRGKKLKRNPTEVLHDLIGGHMEEILEAGGIGCFTKHAAEATPPAVEAGKVQSSRRSNASRNDDFIKPKWLDDGLPSMPTSTPMKPDSRKNRGSWNDQSRARSDRQDDLSRSFKEDLNTDTGSQGSKYARKDVGSAHDERNESSRYKGDDSRGKSRSRDSHHSSDRHHRDDRSLHSRSRRDHGRDSKGRWEDTSASHDDRYISDYERDQSHSQRNTRRREGSVEEDSFEWHQSGDHRGKSKSRR